MGFLNKKCMVVLLCVPFRCDSVAAYDKSRLQEFARIVVEKYDTMHIGIKAVSLVHNETLCAVNEDRCFIPASNTKLCTALLAFELLGSDYCFETVLVTDGVVEGSVLYGSVYLKVSGDPSLTQEHLEQLLAQLRAQGIETVAGDVCVDTTEFDDDLFQPGSFIDNVGYAWNTPTTAFSLNSKAGHFELPCGGALVSDERIRATSCNVREALKALFARSGIVVTGAFVAHEAPRNVQALAVHRSAPMTQLVRVMMRDSNNLYADCIFKKVGAVVGGVPGNWQKGYFALRALLEQIGIDPQGLIIMDGAGRSRYNLISPTHVVTLLQWAYKRPYFEQFLATFAVPGAEGTLKHRMLHLGACIRGKTGTMQGISALCGYALLPDDLVAFSILINGFISKSLYAPPCKAEVEDAFCSELVGEGN